MTKHTLELSAQDIPQCQLEAPFLHEAGVRTTSVRFNGTLHDCPMLNPSAARPPSTDDPRLRKAPGTS